MKKPKVGADSVARSPAHVLIVMRPLKRCILSVKIVARE
jgi:hypothetical protein